ncbi:MAG: lysozyme, partial [Hyphomicrobiaceae bacterium]|nr:lysozyme [Hyphomicrobiaceae bacterium]
MQTSYLDAIKRFEGFSAKAKWDYAQNTNGYGTKARFAGETITTEEAERRFQAEIAKSEALVDKFAPNVDEGTRAALTSLTFNAGTGWMNAGLGDAVRAGDLGEVRRIFVQYDKAGNQSLPGLTARRLAEVAWIGGEHSTSSPTAFSREPAFAISANVETEVWGQNMPHPTAFMDASSSTTVSNTTDADALYAQIKKEQMRLLAL